MKLLIYMPALNEEDGIEDVIKHMPKHVDGIDEIKVLVVDDGSTDSTVKIAKENGADVVSHGSNKGVGSAFQSAVGHCIRQQGRYTS
ncbi:MAG: glycosyltransferase [Candidatus Dojkabacteria bacterium]